MWELDCEESFAPKNWCFWTAVLEKTLESPLDCKEIQWVHPKGDQSWVFIGGTDSEAETPILWPPHVKSWLPGKDPDAGKDWGQEEKGTTEDEIVGWHHRLDGHGFEWTPGVGDEQGGLVCCGSRGHKELNMTEWLNWTKLTLAAMFDAIPYSSVKLSVNIIVIQGMSLVDFSSRTSLFPFNPFFLSLYPAPLFLISILYHPVYVPCSLNIRCTAVQGTPLPHFCRGKYFL